MAEEFLPPLPHPLAFASRFQACTQRLYVALLLHLNCPSKLSWMVSWGREVPAPIKKQGL